MSFKLYSNSVLVDTDEATSGGSGGAAVDAGASYVVLSATGSLDNERVLTPGVGLRAADAGANGTYTLAIEDNIVATVSGTVFTGRISTPQLTGSLTKTQAGLSAFVAGTAIAITSGTSADQVVIAVDTVSTALAPIGASYLTLNSNAALTNERTFTAGTGIKVADGGANSTYTISVNDGVVATVSGTAFTGDVTIANKSLSVGSFTASVNATAPSITASVDLTSPSATLAQITGSISKTATGLSLFVAGRDMNITSGSSTNQIVFNTNTYLSCTTYTATTTASLNDAGTYMDMSGSSAYFLVIPTNASVAFPVGTVLNFGRNSAAGLTVSGAAGVTIGCSTSSLGPKALYSQASLLKRATDIWILNGDLG
jgi:hypothetical protein